MLTFEDRFKNWVRWCYGNHSLPHVRCGSAEGRYRSPQIWEILEPKQSVLNPINTPDAVEVNRAYIDLDDYNRRVIKYVYFRPHWRPSWMAQKLGCHYTQIFGKLTTAKMRMRIILDKPENWSYKAGTGNRSKPLVGAFAHEKEAA